MYSVAWKIRRKEILPMLEFEANHLKEEEKFYGIYSAIGLIEKAKKFHGFPCDMPIKTSSGFSISFSLVFPSQEEISKFIEKF